MKISKLIYIVLTSFLIIGSISAQTPKWVSTEVQKRNIVLEHFTGIGGWFPHGDGKAKDLARYHPNKIIIINNYCGMFATYSQHIDYLVLTTDEGDCIWNEIGLQKYDIYEEVPMGYPEGSINRSQVPWSIYYMKWFASAENIMKENSVVNIYVKPEINFTTRELTVEVEYYYTDDSKTSVNYLSVMLLQNEIVGFMLEAKANPEYAINDTLYRHNHVLRKEITNGGAWGETIATTTKGSYGLKKYTMVLPDSIKNVPLDLTKLEVAAFISENISNIYTGHKAVIEVPEDIRTDLAVEDLTEYNNNNLIFEPIHPKVKITNKSELPVSKFDIGYTLSNTHNIFGQYAYHKIYDTVLTKTETYSGRLNKGESVILEFPEITRSDCKFAFTCITTSVYNIYNNDVSLVDLDITDNTYETDKMCLIDTLFSETEVTFESTDTVSNTGSLPAHTIFDYTLNPFFFIDHRTGAKNTKNSAVLLLDDRFNLAFKPSYIMLGEVDCKDNPNKVLSYYYAYSDGQQHGTSPRIVVDISKDKGKTWERISANICQETGEAEGFEKIYIPTSEEYKYVQINLYDYVKENFLIRIGCLPGTNGEALWIDEISIKNADNEGIEENTKLSVYPNPATNILHINNNNLLGEEYEIYDLSGKLIIKDINNSNIINVENLSAGTYSLKIKDNIFNFIKE